MYEVSSVRHGMSRNEIPSIWLSWFVPSVLVVVFIAFELVFVQPVYAAAFIISSGDDAGLVNAINTANSNGQVNTIYLRPGTYTLTAVNNKNTDGANGLPSITSKMTIKGADAKTTVVQRNANAPFFRILHVSGTGSLTLDGLTIMSGLSVAETLGGGIFNDGILTITNSTISSNSTNAGGGGGIFNNGQMSIINSIISENSSLLGGSGGIENGGTMTITKCTIFGNDADTIGGGIGNGGTLTIYDSSIAGNRASLTSGGIFNGGNLTIDNSTIASNSASDEAGGAIGNIDGTLTITNSTIADNVVFPVDGQGGGGIRNKEDTLSVVKLENTILAQNTVVGGQSIGPDCFGPITSLGNNVIGDTSDCTITLQSTDLTGDPGLGTFTDDGIAGNGHFPLLPNSRAIDAGNNAICLSNPILATDQIGDPRVGVCDIGSIEFEPFKNLGACISTLIRQNCSGDYVSSWATFRTCISQQVTFCFTLFKIE